jgi:hypothetical protein
MNDNTHSAETLAAESRHVAGGRVARRAGSRGAVWQAGRLLLASVLLLVPALAGVLVMLASSASAATTFCNEGNGAGDCDAPVAVAVDDSTGKPYSGDVYLGDTGNRRVDVFDSQGGFLDAFGIGVLNGKKELQTCTAFCLGAPVESEETEIPSATYPGALAVDDAPGGEGELFVGDLAPHVQRFSAAGVFELLFGGGVLDAGAGGTGDLSAGSAAVTAVQTTSKRFVTGQTITGTGIPAGTRIVEINSRQDEIVLSQPATATASGAVLSAPTPPGVKPVNAVQTVTIGGVSIGGTFTLEFPFGELPRSGRRNVGGALIATTIAGSSGLTTVSEASVIGNITAGSTTITNPNASGAPEGGDIITGRGIQPGTTLVEFGKLADTLELSKPATATIEGGGFSIVSPLSGDVTAGSNVVTHVEGPFLNTHGKTISGAGIPAGTTIVEENANGPEDTLTLSAPAEASGSGVALRAVRQLPLVAGETVSGPGIPASTTITSVSANGNLTLSAAASASESSAYLHAGLPYDASAAEVQSALEGLANVGAGNVEVSGLAGGPYTVEFKGTRLADTNVPELVADGSGLTPSGPIAVATLTTGASGAEVCTAADIAAGDLCLRGIGGAGAGQLQGEGEPLALDASGNLWAGGVERLQEFSSTGVPLAEVPLPGAGEVTSLAIDTDHASPSFGDFYTLKPHGNGVDEEQRFTPPASGTYTLSFEGQSTAPIPYDAAGPEVSSALEALPAIGKRNVSVQEPEGRVTIAFSYGLSETNVPQMVGTDGVIVETVVQGQPGAPGVLTKRKPDGEPIETLDAAAPFGRPNAVATDPQTGDLLVSDQFNPTRGGRPATILQYSPAGTLIEAFGTGEVRGGPVGGALSFGNGRLFVADAGDQVSNGFGSTLQSLLPPPPGPLVQTGSTKAIDVAKTSATLIAQLSPEGKPTTYRFEYISEAQLHQNEQEGREAFAGAQSTAESGSIGQDFSFHEASATVSSLQPDVAYRVRVVAGNEDGTAEGERNEAGQEVARTFETQPAVAVESSSVSAVTGDSASLEAQLNPLGDASSYHFEFITEAQLKSNEEAGHESFSGAALAPAPDASIGSGEAGIAVLQHIEGLAPDTAYRYRVFAHNRCNPAEPAEECLTTGPVGSFTTQPLGAPGLLDHRQWELVSPADRQGARILPIGETAFSQAAAGGQAMTYVTSSPTERNPEGYALNAQILARRTPQGWVSKDIETPFASVTGPKVAGTDYDFFSEDLSRALLQPFGAFEPSLSAAASEQTAYLRTNFSVGNVDEPCVSACFTPLVSGCPEEGQECKPAVQQNADVPPGTVFGEEEKQNCRSQCGPAMVGANSSLSDIVLSASGPLLRGAGEGGLYEWSNGHLAQVNLLPGGVGPAPQGALGSEDTDARNAISEDGSRVVWSSSSGHIYVTDPATGASVRLDGTEKQGHGESLFQIASRDGSKVFFTDETPLIEGAGASSGAPDLYECEVTEVEARLQCKLSDVTPERAGQPASVTGMVPGASEDGSYLYLVAKGVLAENSGADGEQAQAGAENLYVLHDGAGGWQTEFIAQLSSEDRPDWEGGLQQKLEQLTARVSPDGQWLAFMSDRPLTGQDSRDALSGARDEQVFLYHAQSSESGALGAGTLVCASCMPTGARPLGVPDSQIDEKLVGGNVTWGETWLAGNIPGWSSYAPGYALHQSRYLSNSGRLFFNSDDALSPQDVNGTWDVYEYEPPAVGSCTEVATTFSRRSGGCVDLISSGGSAEESAFLDASESGGDVFFLTTAKLVGGQVEAGISLYDAQECTSSSPCLPEAVGASPPCTTEAACRPAPNPQPEVFGAPASATFSGLGNLTPPPTEQKTTHPHSRRRGKGKHKHRVARAKGRRRKGARSSHTAKRTGHGRAK